MTGPRLSGVWWVLVIAATAIVFALDRSTGSAPVQHLYYLPIVFAAVFLGPWSGALMAIGAVVLYHLANPVLLTASYREADLVQVALFLGSGIVSARLADDSRRLHQLSISDDLTGLLNLRGFDARVADLMRVRNAGTPISFLVLDVDRLKDLNDNHGHRAGADAVRLVGHTVAARLPPGAFGCRFGGDEFVVAVPERDVAGAIETADAIRSAVHAAAPVLAGTNFAPGALSISIGIGCLSHGDETTRTSHAGGVETAEALFQAADRALYASKAAGRNRITVERVVLADR